MSEKNLLNQNHFEKFSLLPNFSIDVEKLENTYLELQKKFHPDSLIGKSSAEQNLSISNSIALNEAFEILKNPLKRGVYLLKLNGIDIESENLQIKPDQEILIEILELREKISEAKDFTEKNKIKKIIQEEIKKIIEEVALILNKHQYQIATQKLIKAKYLDKILVDMKLRN